MNNTKEIIEAAVAHYKKGNLPQADALARFLIANKAGLPQAYNLLGMIAHSTGMYDISIKSFKSALTVDPKLEVARQNLLQVRQRIKNKCRNTTDEKNGSGATRGQAKGFILIKAWGYGFWSDMDHVLGQLLIAEITGRVPIVYWGKNSLFHDGSIDNAFELYFKPVSRYSIDDINSHDISYFPPKWNRNNLLDTEINKWAGNYSRVAGLYLLARDEDVVVSDFHTYISDLVHWIPQRHHLYHKTPEEIYRYLFKKYIVARPEIKQEIDDYWHQFLDSQHVLAVHIRGSDKIKESENLHDINQSYPSIINRYLSRFPDTGIFLLTDSENILNEYQNIYGGKLFFTECTRTAGETGIHYHEHENKRKLGTQVIKDVYLAARCQYFVGLGHSNVSTTILHMKNWRPGNYHLMSDNALYAPHLFLHNW